VYKQELKNAETSPPCLLNDIIFFSLINNRFNNVTSVAPKSLETKLEHIKTKRLVDLGINEQCSSRPQLYWYASESWWI